MLLVTTKKLTGKDYKVIENKGIISASATEGMDSMSSSWVGFDMVFGGEISSITRVINTAVFNATEKLIIEAENVDANGIVCLRYETSDVNHQSITVLAYGTAVKIKE